MSLLITPAELAAELETVVPPLLLDLRPAEAFARGQIPGAFHLDLWGLSLIDTSEAPLRAFMWMIGHLFSLRGVMPERPVVVYEEDSGVRAARAFWFLEYLGHPNVRLLDGGVKAWTAGGHQLSDEPSTPTPSPWHGTAQPERVASRQHVREQLGRPDTTIVDTRSDAEWYGEEVRARRGGVIPGAVHLEWKHNLAADGRFKPREELAAMYGAAGISPACEVVTYCQGGYRAAHSYLALRLLGFPRLRNYVGSWKEWGDSEEPIERVPRETRP